MPGSINRCLIYYLTYVRASAECSFPSLPLRHRQVSSAFDDVSWWRRTHPRIRALHKEGGRARGHCHPCVIAQPHCTVSQYSVCIFDFYRPLFVSTSQSADVHCPPLPKDPETRGWGRRCSGPTARSAVIEDRRPPCDSPNLVNDSDRTRHCGCVSADPFVHPALLMLPA